MFRSVCCADNDPSTHSDEDQTPNYIQGLGHSWMYETSVTAVERGPHWSMIIDMNMDS